MVNSIVRDNRVVNWVLTRVGTFRKNARCILAENLSGATSVDYKHENASYLLIVNLLTSSIVFLGGQYIYRIVLIILLNSNVSLCKRIHHYFSLHVSTRHTFCFYIIYLELGFDKIYVAVLSYLKVSQPQKFRYLFYCFIEIFKRLGLFRCKDEQYPITRSGRIFRRKRGLTGEIFSVPCFVFVTS